MLLLLHIENIAVIEAADICFDTGFNVLTGETGAGKSIVIDALGAVLGRRTSRDLIRTGAGKALVSAQFSGVSASILTEFGLEEGEDLLLQREMTADGRNVCRVNGRPVSVAQLRELGSRLLDIHGQHDGQQLLDEERHGEYLDRFGMTEGQLAAYRKEFEALSALRAKIRSLAMDESEKARRMDTLRFQISELERAELTPGEEETLAQRREILRNSEKFSSAIDGAEGCLSGGEDSGGAVGALRAAEEELRSLKRYGGSFGELAQRLHDLCCEAEDVSESLRELRREYAFSPEELDQVEERCDRLYRLKKKYGSTVEEMLDYLERCRAELDRIEFADDTVARLREEEARQERRVREEGKKLSDARKGAAEKLEERILQELRQLDMPKVQFRVDFSEKEPDAGGMDAIRFLMSANLGEALKPIDRVASGGELARIMLALKNVLAEQ
ncbi:MAG: DNA repair protein RecN, partial [Oscillospiraceae bacterium]